MNGSKNNSYSIIYGVIMDEQTLVKTDVHGDINTTITGYGGNVTGKIGSTTHEEQQFWVQKDDGHEIHVDLREINGTLPVRKGHNVILAYFEKRQIPSALYIENTKKYYLVTHACEKAKFSLKKILKFIATSILLFLVLFIVLMFNRKYDDLFFPVYIATIVIYFWRKIYLNMKQRKQREEQIAADAKRYIFSNINMLNNKSQ